MPTILLRLLARRKVSLVPLIKDMECFECGATENLIQHHVIPRIFGGNKTICLCQKHHDIIHNVVSKNISISELTKQGIHKARNRGIKLGNPKPERALKNALKAKQERADVFAAELAPIINHLRSVGMPTLRDIAFCLNLRGFKTPNNKAFKPQSVKNLLIRLKLYNKKD